MKPVSIKLLCHTLFVPASIYLACLSGCSSLPAKPKGAHNYAYDTIKSYQTDKENHEVILTYTGAATVAKRADGMYNSSYIRSGNLVIGVHYNLYHDYNPEFGSYSESTLNGTHLLMCELSRMFQFFSIRQSSSDDKQKDSINDFVQYESASSHQSYRYSSKGTFSPDVNTITVTPHSNNMYILGKNLDLTKIEKIRTSSNWSGQKVRAAETAWINDQIPGRIVKAKYDLSYDGNSVEDEEVTLASITKK